MPTVSTRRRYGAVLAAIALAAVGLPLAATSASALLDPNVGPAAPHSITTFPSRDFVNIAGYRSSDVLTVEVWRGGFKVGTTLPFSPSIADPKAPGTFMEDVNHLSEPCWSGVTPDIRGNDVVKVLTSATTGDQAPIANVTVTSPAAETALGSGTVVMTGTAVNAAGGQIPIDQVEARIVAKNQLFSGGKRTLRAASTGARGGVLAYDGPTATTWTATFTGLNTIAADGIRDADKAVNQGESRGMWLGRNPLAFNETTIVEFGAIGGPAAGCTAPFAKGPSVPVMTPATDTGVSASDNITSNRAPTFGGVVGLATATSVNLYVDGVVNGTATVVAGGYSLTPATPLADGIHTITAGETAPGGPETLSTGSLSVTIDTVAPLAPGVAGTSPASPGGSITPSVRGTAEAGSTVSLYAGPACASPAVGSGSAANFAVTGISAPVSAGSTTSFFATATDVAGNASPCSATSTTYAVVAFTAVTPTRVLDTRPRPGAPAATLGARATMALKVPGLPIGATAVALNVTVTNPTAASFLTVYPAGTSQPGSSNLNYVAGQTIPNMVVVPVSPDGSVSIYNQDGTVDVIADLVGYYAPGTGAGFTGTTPIRVLDTRIGTGAPATTLGAGAAMTLTLTATDVPAGATAVALNVTVTNPSAASFLTVYPGTTRPTASNLNYVAGQTIPNLVLVPLGPRNTVTIYNAAGTTDVIADLVGYYAPGTGAGFTGTTPTRVLDTRSAIGVPRIAKLGAGAAMTLTVPNLPAGATAVALNVTVTNPTAGSYLSAYPGGSARPDASNLNYVIGQTIPNLVMVPVGPGGTVTLFNAAGTVDVIADLVGYYN